MLHKAAETWCAATWYGGEAAKATEESRMPASADDPLRTGDYAANAQTDVPPASDTGREPSFPAGRTTTPYLPGPDANLEEATPRESPTESLPRVCGYEIESVLGRGGVGVVYKARHLGFKRVVALKMILSAEHASAEERSRFRAEAEAIAKL
jgi:serine/threonine protein kinase